ncbi:MAG: ATP-binding protein [Acidimicrobiia bacterium]|nr:ATP-binding protein [Acidimicrobiia bacterium]
MECVILIGLPGAGKSSVYRERFAGTHDHVSKDLMRPARRPQRRQAQLVAAPLAAGRPVVIDNTNPAARGGGGVRQRRRRLPVDAPHRHARRAGSLPQRL